MRLFKKHTAEVRLPGGRSVGADTRGFWRNLFRMFFSLCYAVGVAVVSIPKFFGFALERVWLGFVSDVGRTVASVGTRGTKLLARSTVFNIVFLFLFAVVWVFGLQAVSLFAEGLGLQRVVVGQAETALESLAQGTDKLSQEEYAAAGARFATAIQKFGSAQQVLAESNALVRALLDVTPQGKDAQRLLRAGEQGSQAAKQFGDFLSTLKQISFGSTGLELRSPQVTVAYAGAQFRVLREQVDAALALVREVDPAHVPDKYADRLASVQKQVLGLKTSLGTVANAFSVLEYAATGNKELLVLLQNSNELRPSGGFIGTYGAFTVQDGVILNQTVSSIYDIDGQLRTVYEPPLPIRAVNPRWYIRDANWFASFPESARAVSGMYTEVTQRAPDLVMAITPALVVRALELTGPVVVPGYATPLTAENFVEVTQVETSVTYDRTENKPKKMLAEFLPIFLERLSAVVQEEPLVVLQVLVSSVAAKDVQLYSPNTTVQAQVRALAWSGEIVETARDYFSIVSANLGGTKTDLELEQSVVLHSAIDASGAVINTLTLRRANPLPDKKGLENKSFVRVLVPLGSTLLSSKGFSEVVLDEPKERDGVVHPQAQGWQKAAAQQTADGTVVGVEAGKTFFGNWIVVAGGQTAQVELSWRLPYTLSALDRQSLTVQKQSGAVGYSFQYKLEFPQRRVLWSTQDGMPTSFGLEKEWQVTTDSFFGVVLSK